jgi:hypothetical protein
MREKVTLRVGIICITSHYTFKQQYEQSNKCQRGSHQRATQAVGERVRVLRSDAICLGTVGRDRSRETHTA